ncbi:MAG: hypothetical protein MAG715_00240 [Methanonatronarchaeales archaeon]|nr:hypothetical protein [Methanonatronarchaeales archaeon]
MATTDVLRRLANLERELEEIKRSLRGEKVEMGGRLEGASFGPEDFEEAERSLFETG